MLSQGQHGRVDGSQLCRHRAACPLASPAACPHGPLRLRLPARPQSKPAWWAAPTPPAAAWRCCTMESGAPSATVSAPRAGCDGLPTGQAESSSAGRRPHAGCPGTEGPAPRCLPVACRARRPVHRVSHGGASTSWLPLLPPVLAQSSGMPRTPRWCASSWAWARWAGPCPAPPSDRATAPSGRPCALLRLCGCGACADGAEPAAGRLPASAGSAGRGCWQPGWHWAGACAKVALTSTHPCLALPARWPQGGLHGRRGHAGAVQLPVCLGPGRQHQPAAALWRLV